MKKKLLLLLLSPIILMSFFYDDVSYTWEMYYLKGKVRTLTEKEWINDTLGERGAHILAFSSSGKLKNIQLLDSTGKTMFAMPYTYARNGRLNEWYISGGAKVVRDYTGEELRQTALYRKEKKTGEWKLVATATYSYEGKITERKSFSATGNYTGRALITLDNQGRPVEELDYNKKDSLLGSSKRAYDKDGHIVKFTSKGEPSLGNRIYTYNGDELQSWSGTSGIKGAGFETHIFKYEYDTVGNWIKRQVFKNDTLFSITNRSIEYY